MDAWNDVGIKYFKPEEFDDPTKPGSGSRMNIEFVKILDIMRGQCGFPFKINSGFRCADHNADVGGVEHSAHTAGIAADIYWADDHQRYLINKFAILNGFKRIGDGADFWHLDLDYTKPQEVIWSYKRK